MKKHLTLSKIVNNIGVAYTIFTSDAMYMLLVAIVVSVAHDYGLL